MITKPEEAKPDTTWITTRSNRLNSACDGPARDQINFFTASECAEIARAYASALHASEFNSAGAAIIAAKWEAEFNEWENAT